MKLVNNWGGFEEFVADLHRTGSVSVQRNVTLIGQSGAPRQIDVLVTHREGLYEHRIIIECKLWTSKIKRTHIDAMATAVKDLRASKGVFFTTKGYQSGAETAARAYGIDIFIIRDLTAQEWGLPGQIIDFYIQCYSRSIGNLQIVTYAHTQNQIEQNKNAQHRTGISIALGGGPRTTTTPIFVPSKPNRSTTLEEFVERLSIQALMHTTKASFTINGGEECTRYLMAHMNMALDPPIQVHIADEWAVCHRITFDLGIKVSQSRITIDRAVNYEYAIAVEDCINGIVYAVSKNKNSNTSTINPIELQAAAEHELEDVLKNGSIFRLYLSSFFDFSELNGLRPVTMPKIIEEAVSPTLKLDLG